jgi:hypothetical protein
MKSFIGGIAYRVGDAVSIEELFEPSPEGKAALNFFLARGLKYFRRQSGAVQDMFRECIVETLFKSGTSADALGAVLADIDEWCFSEADRLQILESLHLSGLWNIPVIGVGLQSCSAAAATLDLADRMVRTDEGHRPILVLMCGRPGSGENRINDARKTILSDGVATCIVTARRGEFQLLSSATSTDLAAAKDKARGGDQAVSLVSNCNNMTAVATEVCTRAGVSTNDIDQLFCSNGSSTYINFAAEATEVGLGRVYSDDVASLGHIFSCDNLISLATYAERRSYRIGAKYMLIGWSAYVISGAILLYCGNHSARTTEAAS